MGVARAHHGPWPGKTQGLALPGEQEAGGARQGGHGGPEELRLYPEVARTPPKGF